MMSYGNDNHDDDDDDYDDNYDNDDDEEEDDEEEEQQGVPTRSLVEQRPAHQQSAFPTYLLFQVSFPNP